VPHEEKPMRIRFLVLGLFLSFTAVALPSCKKSPPPAPEPTAASAVPSAGTTWVCPMDPDVTSDKPGRCPKCGMELIPQK
jgi:hypothetical protein